MKQIVSLVVFLSVMAGCSAETVPTVHLSDGGMDATSLAVQPRNEISALNLRPNFGEISVLSLTAQDEAVIQTECDNQFLGTACGAMYHDDVADCVADVIAWVESLPAPCQSTAISFLDCENEDPCWETNHPSVCDPERSVFLTCLNENQPPEEDAGF